jgi:PKD domain.
MLKTRFGIILAIVVMLTACISCSPSAEPTTPTPPKPSGNQAPVISSLTPEQTKVHPLSIIEMRCVASDPDGDTMSYDWSATGGSFSGTGSVVSWKASQEYGDYDIKVTVKDDNDNTTFASVTVSVVANQDPEILSLVAKPVTVLPQGRSAITCVATDPDGNALNYNWSASAGSVTGVGNEVTWVAPEEEGTYTITLIVDDGNGGQVVSTVSVTVKKGELTETFTPVAKETGTVSSDGDKDTSRTITGDDASNLSYRSFWSFDIYSLKGADIKDAKLTFTTKKVVWNPFAKPPLGLDGLRLWRVRYKTPGQLPKFNIEQHLYGEITPAMWETPTVMDVTKEVQSVIRGTSNYLQLEATFQRVTNDNHIGDYIEWKSLTLTITYAK